MSKSNLKGRMVYLVAGSRTPFLKALGKPGPFRASDLAVAAGRPLLTRQPFEPDALDEVILGCVSSGPDEANIARISALRLGCGHKIPAWTVHRNCASGMQAVDSAALNIATGRAELVLAGGTEAMSHHPVLLNNTKELNQIYSMLDELEPIAQEQKTFRPQRSLFHWPLAVALALSFIIFVSRLQLLSRLKPNPSRINPEHNKQGLS